MTRAYPEELRRRVVYLLVEGYNIKAAANLHVSKTFVKKIKRLFVTNQPLSPKRRPGKCRLLSGKNRFSFDLLLSTYFIYNFAHKIQRNILDQVQTSYKLILIQIVTKHQHVICAVCYLYCASCYCVFNYWPKFSILYCQSYAQYAAFIMELYV